MNQINLRNLLLNLQIAAAEAATRSDDAADRALKLDDLAGYQRHTNNAAAMRDISDELAKAYGDALRRTSLAAHIADLRAIGDESRKARKQLEKNAEDLEQLGRLITALAKLVDLLN